MAPITLRPPTFSPVPPPPDYQNPSIYWLTEEWHVTHSTLPMWKSKRNVRIQYTPLPPSTQAIGTETTDRLDDLVTYQSLTGEKINTVKGVDKAAGGDGGKERGAWDWRGKGWLAIAGSHWEILGWGEESSGQEGTSSAQDSTVAGVGGNKWVVTMFAKTLFTPAGLDVYSLRREGLRKETLEEIKRSLATCEDGDVKKMSGELFEVKIDDARK